MCEHAVHALDLVVLSGAVGSGTEMAKVRGAQVVKPADTIARAIVGRDAIDIDEARHSPAGDAPRTGALRCM